MSDINELIANNLLEKDSMKVTLSNADSGVNQHVFFRKDKTKLKVAQITINQNAINDSFYLNHTTNGRLKLS